MKKFRFLYLFFIISIYSCSTFSSEKEFPKLKIWEEMQKALKEGRIEYLLEISKDTLECIECNNGENFIPKEAFFSDYISQIMQPENEEYLIYSEEIETDDSVYLHRINYLKEYKGHKYNIIYTILEKQNGFQYLGVFTVP